MFTNFHCATTVADGTIVRLQHPPQQSNLHYRFVFTTRDELISADWREAFYKIIANDVRALGGNLASIGGTNQTVNLRVVLPPTASPDQFARRLKILSASWARRKANRRNFVWREDYEAVTLDSARSTRQLAERFTSFGV